MGLEENFGNKINSNGFDKNPSNINLKGRKPKIYNLIKELGYTSNDAILAFKELSFNDLNELKGLKKDEKKPIILRIVAGHLIKAYENNDFSKAKEILEYVIGKPNQPLQISGSVGNESKHTVEFKSFKKE